MSIWLPLNEFIGAHDTGVSVGVQLLSGETLTPLFVGRIRTQVLADSLAIAASELNHCTIQAFI